MRVLHILDHSIPLHSGYSFRTLSLLKGQRERGWETFHLTSPKHTMPYKPVEEVDGWTFYRTKRPEGPLAGLPVIGEVMLMNALTRRIIEVAREVKPDILHAHSPALNGLPALRAGKKLGIPVMYEVRGFWEDAAVSHGTSREGGLRYRLTRALETYVLKHSDGAGAICDGLRQDIIARGIPQEKLVVIPNAVDLEKFPDQQTEVKPQLQEKLGLTGKLVLGFIGSFYEYEGLDLLLEALPRILEQRSDVKVLFVGGGQDEDHLRRRARELGVEDHVAFAGRVPHNEVQDYYALVDILVYPRKSMRLTDLVTPLKPLEAMAQRRIFIASDVGGHKELIRHGETGTLFKADSAEDLAASVLELAGDRERWPKLAAAGRDYVENVRNWRNSVANYVPLYERLLARSGKGTG
ncbi:TIGR04063 family PEP-CTERM/XrtA system glycosyltransferase [Aestuariispira ectoiniformans]|uniref:TIGR04063 family PEP-CTERM/XrtA system glycosyltransferase n=1 Tax=Aestuariispira ectoiniformans TaxID=2775080 RepID=UPI00223B19C4|nr:TIGR04063 family PEP-CTERM/XrtA system glycosyltransferase [Aestuariispira ectoiniformans]